MTPDSNDIVCYCKLVTRAEIEDSVRHGASTLKDVQAVTGACTGGDCARLNPKGVCCCEDILEIIARLKTSL